MSYDPSQFAEKYHLALEQARREAPSGGINGCEAEWNLLDSQLQPLSFVGVGPARRSFVDYLRSDCISPWTRSFTQLEVFNWMIEWATRPYYTARGAVSEMRMMEAVLVNALSRAGRKFGEPLYCWHGNLIHAGEVNNDCIPGSWHIAKRRYLERCVSLYGNALATAGTHSNLSLPDPLFAWDFMHLPASERGDRQLEEYRSEFYITAARKLRAFAPLFIAASASTPFKARLLDGENQVLLTADDSVRNLTFPNPAEIDIPNLYRSYADYLALSYDLVRRGVRFGNNNWTPVRARSPEADVERLIEVSSEHLRKLYARGLYAPGAELSVEEMARQIEQHNLMARINLPMTRVEVRTDDGGNPLELEIANLAFKQLLMARIYADPDFARAFRYDGDDIQRARRNEQAAAHRGLRSEIENPFTCKPQALRQFLGWTLDELRPLAEALNVWQELQPLVEMANGAPNTAERLRQELSSVVDADGVVPSVWLKSFSEQRVAQIAAEVDRISETVQAPDADGNKLAEFLQRARNDIHHDLEAPIRFRTRKPAEISSAFTDKTSEITTLASQLVRIPSVTACPNERLDEVRRAATFIYDYARRYNLPVQYYYEDKYPALLLGFPDALLAPVMLSGHFDVVEPEPDDSQFDVRVEGDYLWGRGAADMKTVVATYLVFMKDALLAGPPYPPLNLLLVGNEENGETDPMGTPHVLRRLGREKMRIADGSEVDYSPGLLIAGERTGEKGDELWGEVCTQNRGVMRFELAAYGQRGHSGVGAGAKAGADLTERLLNARSTLMAMMQKHLTLNSADGWQSQARFPFIQVGTQGVYNITADRGVLGVEVRPIPQDDLAALQAELENLCQEHELVLSMPVNEPGIACDPDNPYLQSLLQAVAQVSGQPARIARKLAGTSARFAPRGQGVVWGQSGIGPHARGERHYIPSILPYYQALVAFGERLKKT